MLTHPSKNIDCTKLDCFDKQAFSYLAEDENAIHILANGEVGLRVKYAIYDYKTGLPSEAGTEVRESPVSIQVHGIDHLLAFN